MFSRRKFLRNSSVVAATGAIGFPHIAKSADQLHATTGQKPRHIIHLVADGMSMGTLTCADHLSQIVRGRGLSWMELCKNPATATAWMTPTSSSLERLRPLTGRYGVSVLAESQEHLAAHFAAQRVSPTEPPFSWHDGLPFLDGAIAHLGCKVVDVHPAGDHVLWTGQVEHLYCEEGRPLLFYTGRFRTLGEIEKDSP